MYACPNYTYWVLLIICNYKIEEELHSQSHLHTTKLRLKVYYKYFHYSIIFFFKSNQASPNDSGQFEIRLENFSKGSFWNKLERPVLTLNISITTIAFKTKYVKMILENNIKQLMHHELTKNLKGKCTFQLIL